ncbi:MAG: hypothetical protein H7318_13250 [Oligoflexus sp.]|nr:hypothetical protein [Oligoflexus sp.]
MTRRVLRSFFARIPPLALVVTVGLLSAEAGYSQSGSTGHKMEPGMDMEMGGKDKADKMDKGLLAQISPSREGSGTSWMPDESPMYGIHAKYNEWDLMFHGNLFVQSINEGSKRGDEQFGSINWIMAMAKTETAGGNLNLRLMMSAENWTVGKCGYPDLLQTGESCNGKALHDDQHPHDLFMELAASFQRAINQDVGFEIYGGPAGEPALGPVAFPHRLSAFPGPQGPISHHWLDATHISFGVATVGVFTKNWKSELSLFNGREPDDNRTDFDLKPMDSYSGRISYLPNKNWALQISGGHLTEAEEDKAGKAFDVVRYTGSGMYHMKLEGDGIWATTLVYGVNKEGDESSPAALFESSLTIQNRYILSTRVENVEKTGRDLVLEVPALDTKRYSLSKYSLGYMYQFLSGNQWTPGIGFSVSSTAIPSDLVGIYGEKNPVGFVVFASLRPAPMKMEGMGAMHGMGDM